MLAMSKVEEAVNRPHVMGLEQETEHGTRPLRRSES